MAESEVEWFSGDKTAQGQFNLEKNQENAPWNSSRSVFAVEPKEPERKRSSDKGKYARTGKFLKLFVHKKHMSTT